MPMLTGTNDSIVCLPVYYMQGKMESIDKFLLNVAAIRRSKSGDNIRHTSAALGMHLNIDVV